MPFSIQRALAAAIRAWRDGRLDAACEALGRLVEARPGAAEAVFPLARALHERGESLRALELLEPCLAREPVPSGAFLHRALIAYDLGRARALEEDRVRLGPENPLATALDSLWRAREGNWGEARVPPAALWNAEVMGRLLALLEESFAARVAPRDDRFHHALLAAGPPGPEGGAALHDIPARFASRRQWLDAVETSFAARRFEDVLALLRGKDLPSAWPGPAIRPLEVFSWIAAGRPDRASEAARTSLEERGSLELHFLHGLALIRQGDSRTAAHAFVRAARRGDVVVHDVLRKLAAELEVPLALE